MPGSRETQIDVDDNVQEHLPSTPFPKASQGPVRIHLQKVEKSWK